uniref:Heat shock protein n=1 Tax=Solanum tuberosum TaxID=4113 RepID=M1B804_SOLTU
SMTVPDPDFHNFDKDRLEKSFDENQVWAAYDTDDGMPHYYALIRYMISKNPLKVQLSWLNSKNNSKLFPINWVGSGFLKTSRDFRIGKQEINKTLNSFSH